MHPPSPPHPGLYLQQRFLNPLQLTPRDLIDQAGLDEAYLAQLLAGQAAITAPVAQRLGRYFGTTPRLWMDLQADWDLAQHALPPQAVQPLQTQGFLIGPAGATPLPGANRATPRPRLIRISAEDRARIAAQAAAIPAAPPTGHRCVVLPNGQHAWISEDP